MSVPGKTCSVEGCERPVLRHGWCNAHLLRWRRHGDPLGGGSDRTTGKVCAIEGCEKPHEAHGWCNNHYQRFRKHGDPLGGGATPDREPIRLGTRFGRLTVLGVAARRTTAGGRTYVCQCDCGTTTTVTSDGLRSGGTRSCGCLRKDVTAERRTTHGHTKSGKGSRTYKSWLKLRARCTDPNDVRYANYGGADPPVEVCDRWLDSFENFLADMGERPEGTSIDRIDVNGNYEPSNCRWATAKEQANNKRPRSKATA